jgi:iron complex outermembrane receptor protein
VDVNTIPTPLLERVEIISGGASAVYGADAVAGVVNFITKENFSGAEISTEFGTTEESDGNVYNVDFVLGGNFEDDKGNAVVYGSYTKRDAVDKVARPFAAQATTATSFFPGGSFRPGQNPASQAAIDALFGAYGSGAGTVSQGDTLSFNADNSLFSVGDATGGVQHFTDPVDINVATAFFPDFYSFNFEPLNKLVLPLERTSLGGKAHFDVGANTQAYAHVFFTNYNAQSSLAPSPAPTGTNFANSAAGVAFFVPVTNPFIPADLATLLASRDVIARDETGTPILDDDGNQIPTDNAGLNGAGPTEDFLMRTRFLSLGPRIESYENDIYQGMLGFKGQILNGWNWDVYYATGRYTNQLTQFGNARVSAVQQLLTAPDGGDSICAGGLNLFGNNPVSPECAAFIGVTAKNTTTLEQQLAEAVISGNVFEMPAGDAAMAVGAFYQKQDFRFLTDSVLASGDVAGFNAQDAIEGSTDNTDFFAELLLPLLRDKPAVTKLDLTLGYRFSDHSVAGSNSSYKGEVDWGITDAVRARGTYQRAVRAPSIGELFSPQQEDNPQATDPCNFNSTFRTGPDAAAVRTLCLAQGVGAGQINNFVQTNAQIDALAGGNPDLFEESADTYTLGVVWQPTFDSPVFSRFSASIDYWNIKIEDAINAITPDLILNTCFNGSGTNPTLDINNAACQLFGRDPASGEINDLEETQQNLSKIDTYGVDLQVDWGMPIGERWGQLGFNFVASWMGAWKQQIAVGEPTRDYAGSIGDDIGDYLPEWKGTLTTSWKIGAFNTQVRLRYLDSAINEAFIDDPSCDQAVDCTGVPTTYYVDLSTSWAVTDAFNVRLGVDNLMNQQVRLFTPNVQAATDPSVYDVLGRKYFLLASYSFGAN